MKRPDLFIVGTMKAGTTALYEYLRAHPQVFMCIPKEPLYFGRDLNPRFRRMTEAEYLDLFKAARPDQRAGEATPLYLSSTSAAQEIAAFAPDARIIIMLRNPVDVMHAQHGQVLFNESEDITDFASALAAEPERKRGERIPPSATRAEALHYRELVDFVPQVRRFLAAFDRSQVHFVVFDDFVADAAAEYRRVLEFIGVDPDVKVAFTVHNPSQAARSRLVQRLLFSPPRPLRWFYGRMRRLPFAHWVRDRIQRANSRRAERRRIDPELRAALTVEFAPKVAELGELIGRDLSAWSRA
ncbi:MAG: sulfotransferase [Chloroflexota bacterium]